MTAVVWLLVLLPAVAGAALCTAGRAADRAAPWLSVATATVVTLLAAVAGLASGVPRVATDFVGGAAFGLAVDPLAAVVAPTVGAVTLLVLLFAAGDIEDARARFHGLMLLFTAAVMVTVTSTTLVTLLLGWEVMGATSYALIGFWWRDDDRVSAGGTAFLTTRAADLGLYLAAGAALAGGAGLGLDALPASSPGWRHVVAAGVLVAALGKAAQLPFSFWLSRAMLGPSPVSALLHSAAMVAMGGYLLLRTAPLLDATGWAAPTASWIGASTALLLGAVALAQRDLKQLLAASTSAQLGFVVLAAGSSAIAGGTAHLVAHAATKAVLFLAAGAWLSAVGTKQLAGLRGVARRWPVVGVAFAIGALSLAGVVPLSLWATKDAVLAGAHEQSTALYVVALAGAALSAAYAGKALLLVWRRPGDGAEAVERHWDAELLGRHRVGWLEQGPMVVLAAGAAVLGVLALPPAGEALQRALGVPGEPSAGPGELALSAVLALVVLAAVSRWRPPEPTWAREWLGLEPLTQAVVVRPVLALAERLARFDDRVLAAAVDRAAGGTLALGRLTVGVERRVDAAVEAVATGARRLGAAARRPQTGQLHQYYLQTLAVLAAGALLLLVVT